MPVTLTWQEIAIRLALSVIAGGLIGFDRGEHGHAAGLRTTLLVCLASAVAMIQANLLLATAGKTADSFVTFDVMRLPLGILTGMGFIGGGAILRRDGFVLGVTTAATLWFVTVVGLCFGGGQIKLGLAALGARADCALWSALVRLSHETGTTWNSAFGYRKRRAAARDDPSYRPEGRIQNQRCLGRLFQSDKAAGARFQVAMAGIATKCGGSSISQRATKRSARGYCAMESRIA